VGGRPHELHLPLEACLRLVRLAIDLFVQRGLSEADWEVPDEVLALFPDDVHSSFRPRPTADETVAAPTKPAS